MGWFSQNGTGYDTGEQVQKVAMLSWDVDTLAWVRQGAISGSGSVPGAATPKKVLFDQVSSALLYIGKADTGAAIDAASWAVTKIEFDGNNFPTSITRSNAGSSTARWDQRAVLAYS